jgi:hypothetical protein
MTRLIWLMTGLIWETHFRGNIGPFCPFSGYFWAHLCLPLFCFGAIGAERKRPKNHSRPWPTQLSYAIATKINNTSQLTPYGALPIAIVSRIMPAAASKTARSSLLLSECRGPFYSTIQRYNSAPPMTMTNASTVHAIIYCRSGHHYNDRRHRIMPASTAAASLLE